MSGEELKFIQKAFESNYIAPLGPMVDAFEHEFAEKVGIPYAVAVSSGTADMHLGLGEEKMDILPQLSTMCLRGPTQIKNESISYRQTRPASHRIIESSRK